MTPEELSQAASVINERAPNGTERLTRAAIDLYIEVGALRGLLLAELDLERLEALRKRGLLANDFTGREADERLAQI